MFFWPEAAPGRPRPRAVRSRPICVSTMRTLEQTSTNARLTSKGSSDVRRLPVGKQILFSAIIVCALLVLLEGTIRLWPFYFRTSYERYNWTTGRLELVPNLRYTTPGGGEFWINSRGFVGPEFEDQPTPGVYRILPSAIRAHSRPARGGSAIRASWNDP